MSSRSPLSSLRPTSAWVVGLGTGVVGTLVRLYLPFLGILLYVILAAGLLRRGPRSAAAR